MADFLTEVAGRAADLVVRIGALVRHSFEACGSEPAEYIEVFCSPKDENRN